MIRRHRAATGATVAVFLILACRDAPTAPVVAVDAAPSLAVDKDPTGELKPAQIISAYTEIAFFDGYGGQPLAEFRVGMEYTGNRASMSTSYSITGDGVAMKDEIRNQQDAFYNPSPYKRWDEIYYVPTSRNCGLLIEAQTQHQAWLVVWLRWLPNWESTKATRTTLGTPLQLDPCDPDAPPSGGSSSGGGGGSGGWITVETCHYWAHFVGGVLVSTELRYCEFDAIPIADE